MTSSIRLLAAALAAPSVLGITASAAPNSTPQPAPQPAPQIEILTIDDIAPAASSAQIRPHAPPAESSAAYIAELAVDVDHEFYLHNGADLAATIEAVQDLLTLARSAFLAGPGVELLITEIVVRTDANDPYTTSNAFEFFAEARAVWAGNPIPHDIVLVISGKDLEGSILGLAALNSICSDDGVALVAPSPVESSLGSIIVAHELARLVEVISKRPQVQERMTETIADLLEEELDVRGVAVVIEASHSCMTMRGIRKPGSLCVTSAMRGKFRENATTRAEVMHLMMDVRQS